MTRVILSAVAFIVVTGPLSAHAVSCVDVSRTLSLNSKGADVSTLQLFLHDNAVYSGQITGNFGPRSREALGAWQIKKGIVANSYEPADNAPQEEETATLPEVPDAPPLAPELTPAPATEPGSL